MGLYSDGLTIPPAGSLNGTGKSATDRQLPAAASRAVVPLVYGEDRIGGLVLNVLAQAGTPGTLLVQVLWCFACDSVNDVRLNDQDLPAGVTITHYLGDQTATDATLVAAFAAQGISGVKPLTGYAWSLLAMPAALFDGQINVTARIRGRRCYDPAFDSTATGGSGPQRLADPSTWTYTEIPAVCLGDFLANTVYGCGEPVDWQSVLDTAGANRAIVPGSSEQRRLVGVSFTSPAAVRDVAETLRAYAGCFLLPSSAGVRLLADADDAPVATYRHSTGDIAAIDALELRDLSQVPTAVEIIYTDTSAIPWRDASAIAQLDGAGTTKPWRLSQVRLPGIHRYSQALREATERLNKLVLGDFSTSVEVFDIGIRHQEGDVITVDHPLGLSMAAMRVTSVGMPSRGRWRLGIVRHASAAYSDSVASVAPTVDGSRILPVAPPSDVAGLTGTVSKGIITWRWTPATDRFYSETRLRVGGTDWDTATPLWSGRGNSLVQTVIAAGTYTLRARHALLDGQESAGIAVYNVTVTPADLDASAPDLTPPPQPDLPTITAGFASLLIEQAAPAYIEGHGHGLTRLYGKVYTGGALPTFSDAHLIDEFTGTSHAYATALGTSWRLWIKWVSKDGVESATPAGGTNGIAATTGLVGSSDLGAAVVLAQNLAPGSVTADKAALDIGGDNLLGNNSFEVDSNADGLADGWGQYNNTAGTEPATYSRTAGRISGYAQRVAFTSNTTSKGVLSSPVRGGGFQPNTSYVVSWYARASSAQAFGTHMAWNVNPASYTQLKNPNLSTTWQRYAYRFVTGASAEPTLFITIGYGANMSGWVEFDDVQVEQGDTLSGYSGKLAANSIVAGDGAIGNAAITNLLVADAAIDNAKIASLSVAKLVAGSLAVGQYIRSTSYVAGTSGWNISADGSAEFGAASIRGQLTAPQIDTRNLTIKDAAGNVLFGSGTNLASTYINPAAGWLNSNVSVDSNGAIQGIGTGAGASVANNLTQNGVTRIPHPVGATIASSTSAQGGALWMVLPVGWNNTMIRMDVEVFEYGSGSVQTYTVGGYVYGPTTSWYNTFATYSGSPSAVRPVVFGMDTSTGRPMIAIGQFAGSWSYPQIKVSNLVLGYTGATDATWQSAFALTFEVSRGYTQHAIVTSPTPGGAMSGIDQITSGNASTYIANAAIGAAQVGVLTAGNLTVSALSGTINGGVTSGSPDPGRVEVTANRIDVYDSSNQRRVRIGLL